MTDTAPIYAQLWHERYDHPNTTQHHPETPVTLANDIQTGIDDAKQFLGDHFAGLLGRAAQLEANPVVAALEAAALGPQFEAMVANLVHDLAGLVQAKSAAAVAAAQAPAEPLPVPGDPATDPSVPAGPFVGGQA